TRKSCNASGSFGASTGGSSYGCLPAHRRSPTSRWRVAEDCPLGRDCDYGSGSCTCGCGAVRPTVEPVCRARVRRNYPANHLWGGPVSRWRSSALPRVRSDWGVSGGDRSVGSHCGAVTSAFGSSPRSICSHVLLLLRPSD